MEDTKLGTTFEVAAWYLPGEEEKAKVDIDWLMKRIEAQNKVVLGQRRWSDLVPGDERVPEPPKGSKPGVRILVCEADAVALLPTLGEPGYRFSRDIEMSDLIKLRAVTQFQYLKANPKAMHLPAEQLDGVIDEAGPKAGMSILREWEGQRLH